MTTLQLLLLIPMTLGGAWVSGRVEAREYSLQVKLNHFLLWLIRAAVAVLMLRLVALIQPMDWPMTLKGLLYMMGIFGPAHRLVLNLTRQHKYYPTNRTIRWYHMAMKGYDWIVAGIPNLRLRFLTICTLELTIAIVMFIHLNNRPAL